MVKSTARLRSAFVFDDDHTGIWPFDWTQEADYITDFSQRAGDRINLRAMDANTGMRGDQAFTVIGTAEFTGPGQLRYEKEGSYTHIYLNTDDLGFPDATISLKGAMDLSPSSFIL